MTARRQEDAGEVIGFVWAIYLLCLSPGVNHGTVCLGMSMASSKLGSQWGTAPLLTGRNTLVPFNIDIIHTGNVLQPKYSLFMYLKAIRRLLACLT